ncbi:acyl carrier protein [Aquabacterium sp. A7-Y]|uniref:acyl carrier protein n=1 Tax=Aquabacterium sp. A7-Y TaxID=1349605 RepID=UPI00223E8515|nr:acyl carrier protein [Aquabacterium sp. A7-Y]MCW7541931.1 acyl carrier protein [Aquabacterium sp. A7-Y]
MRPPLDVNPVVDEPSLRRWLVWRLAAQLRLPQSKVDTAMSFERQGLDSIAALKLSGELERLLERRLSPALLFEHDSIDRLSAFLAAELRSAPASADADCED